MSTRTTKDWGMVRFVGPETENDTLSVEVLIKTLEGIQQLALIFAAAEENRPLQRRFRPPAELRRRYRLRCGVPTAGSYALPLELVDEEQQQQLMQNEPILPRIHELMAAAGAGDNDGLNRLLPDSRYRDRALRELRGFAPKRGERWSAEFAAGDAPEVSLNGQLSHNVECWLTSGLQERAVMTVTGELIRINFDEHKLFIRHPATNRQLECTYVPDIEVDLLDSRRDLIQVTGEFTLDQEGNPLRLTDVTRIEMVDLTPLQFDTFDCNGRRLKATPALRLEPKLDEESQQLYVVDDPELDLHVFAFTRDQLTDELTEHLFQAWDAYAKESPTNLSPKAQKLRDALRRRFQEIG